MLGSLAILAVAAFLDFFRLEQNGYANTYYAAAVRSMLKSWHNFFFVSFDPGGLVSVDKPPLALWAEAASAKIFGFSGWAILLPEALAGVGAVWLLYLLVARYFGRVAGLVAALALAVSPVSVSVNRDNNPDALLALLLVAAVYVGARAVESGRLRTLLLTAVLVGLAFNTKMLAAGDRCALELAFLGGASLLISSASSYRSRIAIWPRNLRAWIALMSLRLPETEPKRDLRSAAYGAKPIPHRPSTTAARSGDQRRTVEASFGGERGARHDSIGMPGSARLLNQALGDQGGWLLAIDGSELSAAIGAARASWHKSARAGAQCDRRGQLSHR